MKIDFFSCLNPGLIQSRLLISIQTMDKYSTIVVLLTFSGLIINTYGIPEAKCKIEQHNWGLRCIIENVDVKSDDGRIKLIGSRETKGVSLRNSYVKTISSDICDAFPKTRNLEINGVHASKIGKHPFVNCYSLKFLYIINNDLDNIEAEVYINTFAHNQQLEFLNLYNNRFKSLTKSAEVFEDLTGLQQLLLSHNCLKEFPKSFMRSLSQNMTTIYLDGNHLKDLDAEFMVKRFPHLQRVHFKNADIPPARLKKIYEIFLDQDIVTDYHVGSPFKKHCK